MVSVVVERTFGHVLCDDEAAALIRQATRNRLLGFAADLLGHGSGVLGTVGVTAIVRLLRSHVLVVNTNGLVNLVTESALIRGAVMTGSAL